MACGCMKERACDPCGVLVTCMVATLAVKRRLAAGI